MAEKSRSSNMKSVKTIVPEFDCPECKARLVGLHYVGGAEQKIKHEFRHVRAKKEPKPKKEKKAKKKAES